MEFVIFYWRSGSGKVHRGVRLQGVKMTAEACNFDTANDEEMFGIATFDERADFCERCYAEEQLYHVEARQ